MEKQGNEERMLFKIWIVADLWYQNIANSSLSEKIVASFSIIIPQNVNIFSFHTLGSVFEYGNLLFQYGDMATCYHLIRGFE